MRRRFRDQAPAAMRWRGKLEMLVPVRTSGSKPPLFLVHDQHGIMPFGTGLARVLGSDHPVYAIHASGMDGRQPATNNLPSMVQTYIAEIHGARLMGPLLIGGLGSGSLAAIEIARELQNNERHVGPVILVDPPTAPGKEPVPNELSREAERQLYERVRQNLTLYASLAENDLPFDARDRQQLHRAALAGVASMLAFGRYVPTPFPGPAQLILCAKAAADFFHPQMPWHKLLSGPRMVHILPWDQAALFRGGREHVAQGLKFLLEEASTLENVSERQEFDAPRIEQMAQRIDGLVSGRAR